MISDIRRGLAYARKNDAKTVWTTFSTPANKHPLVQFTKYGLCGVGAVVVHQVFFILLGTTGIFPHFQEQGHPDSARTWYFIWASLAGFLASDVFAYFSNLKWVFEGGRHHPVKEFILFTAVASIGFFVGLGVGLLEILKGTGSSILASLGLVVTAALVNFVCRKFIIFKG